MMSPERDDPEATTTPVAAQPAGAAEAAPVAWPSRCPPWTPWPPGPVAAEHAKAPRRLFTVLIENGVVPSAWFPTGGEKDFKLAPIMSSLAPLPEAT